MGNNNVRRSPGPGGVPRVLFLIPGNPREKVYFSFSVGQAEALQTLGIKLDLFFLESRTNPLTVFHGFLTLVRRLRKTKYGILHAHFGTVTSLVGACASALARVPLVITFHGSDVKDSRIDDGFVRDLFQRIFSNLSALKASAIICVSERVRSSLWWRKSEVVVIPCGIDLSLFKPRNKMECRKRLGWSPEEKVVLFNNSSECLLKRQDIAEETLKLLNERVPARLCILKRLPREAIPLYLNAADCLLLCSDSEGSPTIVKEAMACNLPVVSTDVGDVCLQLQGCSVSKIVDRDPVLLSEALASILASGSRGTGRERISEIMDLFTTARQVASTYCHVLGIRDVFGKEPESAASQAGLSLAGRKS